MDWMQAQPELDLPESHPTLFVLRDMPALPEVENEDINDIIRLCKLGCVEIENCASARDSSTMNKFDYGRCSSIIDKLESFLTNHIQKVTPIDLPESSPRAPGVTSGRMGIGQ
jgi:hypothetical protein